MKTFLLLPFLGLLTLFLVVAVPSFAVESTRSGVKAEIKDLRVTMKNKAARISGAVVSSVGTNTLSVTKEGKNLTVDISANTQLRRKFWGKATLSEFAVGDQVNIIGMWKDEGQSEITARLVRDVSIQKRHGVFFGTVTAVNSAGWQMEALNRGNQTVNVGTETKFTDRKEQTINQTDIKVGNKVRVRGLWDSKANTISEVITVKDYSIPVSNAGQ